ncbi:condensin subunit ScpA [Marinitoga hydrogenitolerans DSM 16785]|uniref:Segregation and condensation protein A n=1 Tax=Marinitoga hydrogenitolerans (strain DSM 16785 / JCM 12826 / AT1271) TaxID=1122195 RepID=A0A1M4XCK1_MARH1|nr:segregation/condensation protein A [Marinitoga hydrogenitolerans]SHE90952.1 condensin subunit ScpA [Marinitoga hydrogenitolerans DSM 16785]
MFSDLNIELDIFSGPFEVLVQLIKEKKIPVRLLSVSKIADIFNAYVEKNYDNLDDIGEFLRIASYLTLLKSKELLPSAEEDKEFTRERNTLYNIIEDYEKIKETMEKLQKDFGKNNFKKTVRIKASRFDKNKIHNQLELYMNDYLQIQQKLEILRESFTVEEAIEELKVKDKFTLKELYIISNKERLTFIVYFLASLVLVRNGLHYVNENYEFIKNAEEVAASAK